MAEYIDALWLGLSRSTIDVTQPVSHVENFLRNLLGEKRSDAQGIRGAQEELLRQTQSFARFIDENRITALVALNDDFAREYHFWLKAAGIAVPSRMSLISFDNSTASAVLPISTIDLGLAHLGYLSAHILIGDMPVRADKNRNIAGVCRLVDRGSLGKAP